VRWARIALFLVACAVATALILPIRAGQVGFDSAASVLYFDRIAGGRHLEAFVTATPKPLLTVLYGLVFAVAHDWRAISFLAIAAFGLAVVLATQLAWRLGGLAAGGFAAGVIMGSSPLVKDVALSYALVWALIGWLVAGLALTARPPRYALAGLALLFAATARFESLLLSGVAVAALVGWWILARMGRTRAAPPPGAWLLSLGLLALPVQLIHDWLLTGDPWFSQLVPVRGSVGAPSIGPVARIVWIAVRYVDQGGLLYLALVGAVALVIARRWSILLGLAVLGPGIAAFLVFLELRHTYVSTRYAGPIDVAVAFAAAVGFALIAPPLGRLVSRNVPAWTAALALAAGILFASPFAAFSADVLHTARNNLILHRNADAAEAVIAPNLAALPSQTPPGVGPTAGVVKPILLVPVLLRPQMAVDLGLPLWAIDSVSTQQIAGGTGLRPGMLIYHDRRGDPPDPGFAALEVTKPTQLGNVDVVPISADPAAGWWVNRIDGRPAP
jgi:hypothetical protein